MVCDLFEERKSHAGEPKRRSDLDLVHTAIVAPHLPEQIGEAPGVKTAQASVLVRGSEDLIVSGDRLARLLWARQEVK